MSGIDIRSVPEPPQHSRPAPPEVYDLHSALPFVYLLSLGLCENHRVLDIGCGSLGTGRLLIPWLLPKMYFGVDALSYMIERGIQYEIGRDILEIKKPVLWTNTDFDFGKHREAFDFVIANSTLCHLPTSQIEKCMGATGRALKPDGLFLFSVFLCRQDEDWEGEPAAVTRYVCHTKEKLDEIAAQCGLVVQRANFFHPVRQVWMIAHRVGREGLIPGKYTEFGPTTFRVDAEKRPANQREVIVYKTEAK